MFCQPIIFLRIGQITNLASSAAVMLMIAATQSTATIAPGFVMQCSKSQSWPHDAACADLVGRENTMPIVFPWQTISIFMLYTFGSYPVWVVIQKNTGNRGTVYIIAARANIFAAIFAVGALEPWRHKVIAGFKNVPVNN